ncbi:hypothetical protein ACV08C_004992, partial [Escherichia coli]
GAPLRPLVEHWWSPERHISLYIFKSQKMNVKLLSKYSPSGITQSKPATSKLLNVQELFLPLSFIYNPIIEAIYCHLDQKDHLTTFLQTLPYQTHQDHIYLIEVYLLSHI